MGDFSSEEQRLKELKLLLESTRDGLLARLRRAMEEQRADNNARLSFELAQDDGDKSVEDHERHVQTSRQSMISSQLEYIEQALSKLFEGTYGICEECGETIPLERLRIQPFASYCVACQQEIERTGRQDTLWNKDISSSADDVYDYLPEE